MKSKYKKWLVNLVIFIVAMVLILAFAETAMRWIDGYRLSTLELDQGDTIEQSE